MEVRDILVKPETNERYQTPTQRGWCVCLCEGRKELKINSGNVQTATNLSAFG